MKKALLAAALALATPAHANVTVIHTGITEVFAGQTYEELLYIMGPPQYGDLGGNYDSESALWIPVGPPVVTPPPPPVVINDPPPPPPPIDPPPCVDCDPPPPCLTCDPPPAGPATPEASTWLMMLMGFAGLGYASLRRRVAA